MAKCEQRFYTCSMCGNMAALIKDGGGELFCCGEPMLELVANTTDASQEKHVPTVIVDNDKVQVTVGSVAHPMTAEHYIEWIFMRTAQGGQRKCLSPDNAPQADFLLSGDKAVAVYAYCNLHGLWKVDL